MTPRSRTISSSRGANFPITSHSWELIAAVICQLRGLICAASPGTEGNERGAFSVFPASPSGERPDARSVGSAVYRVESLRTGGGTRRGAGRCVLPPSSRGVTGVGVEDED